MTGVQTCALPISSFLGGQPYIDQANIWNSKNTSLPSDIIYSLDFDENGHLWIGTDSGLSYWDGNKFYVWDTSSLTGLLSNEITLVQSRPNGHVFFSAGDGELNQGTGLWHFNGQTYNLYDSSNSNLNNNNVLDLELIGHNIDQNGLTVYENSLWVLCMNDLVAFNYDQPHV